MYLSSNFRYNNLFLNNYYWFIINSFTLFQICMEKKIFIPRFCYHSALNIAGNCRLCLVENKISPKPLASCASSLITGLIIFTKTKIVKKTREGVLGYLLANHPLDCPICDQGGECDLQDQTVVFGGDTSRFYETTKKSTENKNFGFIKMSLNRCIYCGRCSRFLESLVGTPLLYLLGRGFFTEISSYENSMVPKFYSDLLIGNIIDLCPVGALLSKAYSFLVRSWELIFIDSITIFDSLASNIKIAFKGSIILRVLPRLNSFLNEEWICDNTRFFFLNSNSQRLVAPLVLSYFSLLFFKTTWFNTFLFLKNWIFSSVYRKNKFTLLAQIGGFLDFRALLILKNFFSCLGSSFFLNYRKNLNLCVDFRKVYFFNLKSFNWKDISLGILVNSNLRFENPILWLKLRFAFRFNNFILYLVGFFCNLNYFYSYVSNSYLNIIKFLEFYYISFYSALNSPFFLLGYNFHAINNNLVCYFSTQYSSFFKFNLISLFLSDLNMYDLNISLTKIFDKKKNKGFIFYSLGCDNNLQAAISNSGILTIYQGTHGNYLSEFSDSIMPAKFFLEKASLFLNLEGWSQYTGSNLYNFSFEFIKSDFKIFKATSQFFLKKTVNFSYKTFFFLTKKSSLNNNFLLSFEFIKPIQFNSNLSRFKIFSAGLKYSLVSNFFYEPDFFTKNVIFSKFDLNFFYEWTAVIKQRWFQKIECI